ncbi:hypothetical protein niasHS_004058 [Heterodera schachtii]|uniref:Probable cytosolic iron-sulfur protein assembly protein CIAO1 homolog n=1 Tax=Heterodera schachtii TaxID=97005 RepID=A0ABD2JUL9_HETSC
MEPPANCLKSVATALHTEERLRALQDRCWALCWHHSGKLLASCGEDCTVKVWHCFDTAAAVPMCSKSDATTDSEGNGDGSWGSTGNTTNTKLALLCTMRGDQTRSIRSVAFSPCGRLLASASFDASIVVYEKQQQQSDDGGGGGGGVVDFEELHRLEGHENEVKCVAFSASGEHLATCSRDKSVWVWQMDDAGDFQVTSILQHHTADVKFVLWHPREELLVSGGYDGSVRFYASDGEDWCTGHSIKDAHEETVWSASFEPILGDHLATVGTDRTIRIWKRCCTSSSATNALTDQWQKVVEHSLLLATRWPLYTVAWSDSGILAVGGGDCFVRLFTVDQEMCALVLLVALRMDSEVNCVSWRPNAVPPNAKTAKELSECHCAAAPLVPLRQLAVALDSGHIHLLQLLQKNDVAEAEQNALS